jgi:alpha-tubulin suppressor-like RCC1 family protein
MEKEIRYWSYRVLTLFVLAFMAGCGGTSTPATTIPPTASVYYGHSAAFTNNSTMTWGYNAFGQLGNNTTTNSAVPVRVMTLTDTTPPAVIPLTGITAVSVGGDHTLGLTNDGKVFGWGFTAFGQTGNNIVENGDPIARQIKVAGPTGAPLANVTSISAGGNHSLALDNSGKVWTWGLNGNGQLGNGTTNTTTTNQTPLTVSGLSGVKSIAAGGSHSVAIFNNTSTVTSWGYNAFGQLGNGSIIDSSVPVQVKDASGIPLSGIKAIAAGGSFSVAIDRNDNVLVWGYNGFGQLGKDPAIVPFSALPVTIDKSVFTTGTVVAIAAGLDHVLALTSDGTIWAWGYNLYGQLGVAPATTTLGFNFTPTAIIIPNDTFVTTARIDGVNPIVAIGHHNLARRKSDGKLVAWGLNTYGQLGNGTTSDSSTPVAVTGF